MRISVCIPTYKRPVLLQKALESVFQQSKLPAEIIIGDDSPGNETENMIAAIEAPEGIELVYSHHKPHLGQAENMNWLFSNATGSHAVLLHDDDVLLPKCIEQLSKVFDNHPDICAAFGKQKIIDEQGVVDTAASESLNSYYYRTTERCGLQSSNLEVGLFQIFPNCGYMINLQIARSIKWRTDIGNGCEYDFGLRLGQNYDGFYFVDEYLGTYRITEDSIARNSGDDAGIQAFRLALSTSVPASLEEAKVFWLRDRAPVAIKEAKEMGSYKEALAIYFSKYHPFSIRIHPRGLKRLFTILFCMLFKRA